MKNRIAELLKNGALVILISVLTVMLFQGCLTTPDEQHEDYIFHNYKTPSPVIENNDTDDDYDEDDEDEEDEDYFSSSACKFDDGYHTATVYYRNRETGFTGTYTLDVDVEDCEVVEIDFPNGGWLDDDHITPAELDSYGSCTIYGEDSKTYEIQIDY